MQMACMFRSAHWRSIRVTTCSRLSPSSPSTVTATTVRGGGLLGAGALGAGAAGRMPAGRAAGLGWVAGFGLGGGSDSRRPSHRPMPPSRDFTSPAARLR